MHFIYHYETTALKILEVVGQIYMHISFLEQVSHSRKAPVASKFTFKNALFIQRYQHEETQLLTCQTHLGLNRHCCPFTTHDDHETKLFAESDRRSRCSDVCTVKYPTSIRTEGSLISNGRIKWENKHRIILAKSVAGSLSPDARRSADDGP